MTDEAPPPPDDEARLLADAERLQAEGALEGAAWALHAAARAAFARGDDAAAHDRALAGALLVDGLAAGAAPPRVVGWLRLLLSELADVTGAAEASARWTVLAERAFEAARDPAGARAVQLARALRALLRGDGEAGEALAAALAPALEADEPLAACWVRLAWAQRALDAGRPRDALAVVTRALELAPRDRGEHVLAAALAARALLAVDRPGDAARVAAAALDPAGDAAPEARALGYRELGAALAAAGQERLAHLCLDVAASLASTPADLARVVFARLAASP